MQRTLTLALLTLPLLAAVRPEDTYDLTPRFEANQSFLTSIAIEGSFEMDEASVLMNGFDMLEGGLALDGNFGFKGEQTDEVLELRDGEVSKLRRTIDAEETEYAFEFEAMGESSSDDGSESGVLVGYTLELSVDEDGEVSAVDVTEGDQEPLEAEALADQDLEGLGGQGMLPKVPVEIGDSWDLIENQAGSFANFREGVLEGVGDDANSAEIMAVLDIVLSNTTLEATGTLVDVEDGIATIEWTFGAEVNLEDLAGILQAIADPEEIGEIPADSASSLVLTLGLEAAGSFDLRQHQLLGIKATGELSIEAAVEFSEQEMELDAGALLTSTFEITHSIEQL